MKNIEKYKETKDALEAFRAWYKDNKHSVLTMSGWLEKEYEAPPPSTLLEAAEMFVDCVEMPSDPQEQKHLDVLCAAVEREKAKTVRNCDRYKTAREAWSAIIKMCNVTKCEKCQFYNSDDISCRFNWLYAEAGKEKAK